MNCPNTSGDLKYFDKFILSMPESFCGAWELESFSEFIETTFISIDVHTDLIDPMEIDEVDLVFKALEDELYETGFINWPPVSGADLHCYEELS
jgi:hypothetical protein